MKTDMTTISETAALLGLSRQAILTTYVKKLDPADVDRTGKLIRVRFAAVVQILIEREVSERMRGFPSSDDPLMSSGDSPALERYRLAKAQLAELDLEQRRGTLIGVDLGREVLSRWAMHIRKMGERFSRVYGNEATEMINETLADCKASVHYVYGVIDEKPDHPDDGKKRKDAKK